MTKKPLFLYKMYFGNPSDRERWLMRMGNYSDVPQTTEEYFTNTKKWPDVCGVIEPRTRISILKIQRQDIVEEGEVYYVEAAILDGTFAGQIVNVEPISDSLDKGKYAELPIVNPEFLGLVTSTNLTR